MEASIPEALGDEILKFGSESVVDFCGKLSVDLPRRSRLNI